jgi:hypothetical protein
MNQIKWTEADFRETSWHDCQVNSIALDQDGEWQSDLVFHIDFILEWLCGTDKTYRFRVAPAVLRFANVDNLKLDVSLRFKQALEIYSIDRSDVANAGYENFHWTIKLENYPDLKDNVIEFDATGFTQELTGGAMETGAQNLTEAQRRQLKARMANYGLNHTGAPRGGSPSGQAGRSATSDDMRRFRPLMLIAAGLFLLFAGFIYDVMFAGIPYQDPTPEMSARYAHHAHIASVIRWLGLGVFLIGAVAGIIRLAAGRFRTRVVS